MLKCTKDSQIFALALTVSDILTFKFLTFKKYVKSAEYNFRNDAIPWQMSKSANVIFTFLIFAKVWPVDDCNRQADHTHTHTHTHTDRETNKPIIMYKRNFADLPKSTTKFKHRLFSKTNWKPTLASKGLIFSDSFFFLLATTCLYSWMPYDIISSNGK